MADKPINTLPVKTAPSTGDKMLMIGAAEEYQIDYDQLASVILDKLSTKQYSELDTTAKTVLGALDELNGKNPFEANAKNNIDYNDLTAGVHFCYKGCTNSPGDYQRVICLRGQSNQSYDRIQVAYGVSTRKMSLRSMINNAWTEWKTFSDDATVSLYQTITPTNDVLQSAESQQSNQAKFYYLGGSDYTGDIPSGGSYGYGTAIALKRGTASIFVVIISIGKPIYNAYNNSRWEGWKYFDGTSAQ